MVLLIWALINTGKTELLVFVCIPLEYAANAHVTGCEINLEGTISQVTILCRWAVAADVNWAVGDAMVLINSPVGKKPQKSWSVDQASQTGWGGRCNSKEGQEPGALVPVWFLHIRLRHPLPPRLPSDIFRGAAVT